MAVSGRALAYVAGGFVLLYSGYANRSLKDTLTGFLAGRPPSASPTGSPSIGLAAAAGSGSSSSSASGGSVSSAGGQPSAAKDKANQTLGRAMAASYGWSTGAEWTALNNIVMAESGWNAYAANPTSDARGIAQNINGWGPDYQEGNAAQQIRWLLSYIKGRYGDPIKAWQFHLANGWY